MDKPADLTPDDLAEFEERAAIIEFCGKEARDVAEKLAMQLIAKKRFDEAVFNLHNIYKSLE